MPYSNEVWKEALTYNDYIVKIVCSYRDYHGLEQKDLVQEALIGVCEAILRRNVTIEKHEGSFKKYINRCIKSHIHTAIVKTGSLVMKPYARKRADGYFCHDYLAEQLEVELTVEPEKIVENIIITLNRKDSQLILDILSGVGMKEIAIKESVSKQAISQRKIKLYKRIKADWYE